MKLLQALQFNLPIPKEEKITPELMEEFMEKKKEIFNNLKMAEIELFDEKTQLSSQPVDLAELIKANVKE